jgi:hypothetical protein
MLDPRARPRQSWRAGLVILLLIWSLLILCDDLIERRAERR